MPQYTYQTHSLDKALRRAGRGHKFETGNYLRDPALYNEGDKHLFGPDHSNLFPKVKEMLNSKAISDFLEAQVKLPLHRRFLYVLSLSLSKQTFTYHLPLHSIQIETAYSLNSLMTPDGDLLAYSSPGHIHDIRDQAAVISKLWNEEDANLIAKFTRQHKSSANNEPEPSHGELYAITFEDEMYTVIVRAIQPRLLLVYAGGVPPPGKKKTKQTKKTVETVGDLKYPYGDPKLPESFSVLPGTGPLGSVESAASASGTAKAGNGGDGNGTGGNGGTAKGRAEEGCAVESDDDLSVDVAPEVDRYTAVLHVQRKKADAVVEYIRDKLKEAGFIMPHDKILG